MIDTGISLGVNASTIPESSNIRTIFLVMVAFRRNVLLEYSLITDHYRQVMCPCPAYYTVRRKLEIHPCNLDM